LEEQSNDSNNRCIGPYYVDHYCAIAGWLASVVLRGWGMRPIWNIIIDWSVRCWGFIFQALKLQVPRVLSGAIELRLSDILVALSGARRVAGHWCCLSSSCLAHRTSS